jgi:hypothetical protein
MLLYKSNHITTKQITSFLVCLTIQMNLHTTVKMAEFNEGWNWKDCDKKWLCQLYVTIFASGCCNLGITASSAKTKNALGG